MTAFDLHIHTTASDGTMSPAEVVRYAKKRGLQTIAITDHDTIEGLQEGTAEGKIVGLEVIPGVELSVDYSKGTMHVLGYYIDPTTPELTEKLVVVQQARAERNIKIIEMLRALGIHLDLSEVKTAPEHGQIGRPHFAYTMVQKGYVRSIEDAFERYLRKGGPAYVEKFRFSPEEAMGFISKARGITVLAHPFTLNQLQPKDLEALIVELKGKGLDGIEVYYPEHSAGQKKLYRHLAEKYGLVVTGGSDFHGLTKDSVDIGDGYEDKDLTYNIIEAVQKRRDMRTKEL